MNNQITDIQTLFPGLSLEDSTVVHKALLLVDETVKQAPPVSGIPRPKGIDVAGILMSVHIDLESILAALLSDSRVVTHITETFIAQQFGTAVAALVKDVHWLNVVHIYSPDMANQPNQTEILRRMLLAMTHDVRAVLIKLAYRIQRLRNLSRETAEIQLFIAQETLDIYAPLANRLGIHQFKWELEDLAFRYLEPESYFSIAKALSDKRQNREGLIDSFLSTLRQVLDKEGISAKVYGRPKHIYSIGNKCAAKNY